MSRRSQSAAEGTQKFTWTVRQVADGYECICENHPHIKGTGPNEQVAIIDARTKVTAAAEKAELGTDRKV